MTFWIRLGLCSVLIGCAPGSGSGARAAGPFVSSTTRVWDGSYRGRDVLHLTFTGGVETRGEDECARLIVRTVEAPRLELSIIDSKKRSPVCVLAARAHHERATIEPGQACFEAGHVAGIVREGTAELDGSALTLSLHGAVEAGLSDGVLAYRFEGQRE